MLELAFHATATLVENLVRANRYFDGRVGHLAEREQAMARHTERELIY